MLQSGPLVPRAGARRRGRARRRRRARRRALARHRAGARPRRGRPPGSTRADPAAYAAARWDPLDDLVRGTQARGLSLLLSPSTPMPGLGVALLRIRRAAPALLARRGPVRRVPARARAALLGRLRRREPGRRRAAAREPVVVRQRAQPGDLAAPPVRAPPRASSTRRPRCPTARWSAAAIAALRATGHGGDALLLGETSPIGRAPRAARDRSTPPAAFIRTLLCVDARGRALRGTAAAIRGCRGFARLPVTGFAHHPYTQGGSRPPTFARPARRRRSRSPPRGGWSGCSTRARGSGGSRAGCRSTTPSTASRPARRTLLFGVSPARQAAYVNQSDWIAYRDPRVRTVAQYKLLDDPARRRVPVRPALRRRPAEAGLRRLPPAAVDHARRACRGCASTGRCARWRPAATARVELQNAPLAAAASRTVATVHGVARATTRSCARSRGSRAASGCAGRRPAQRRCSRARRIAPR